MTRRLLLGVIGDAAVGEEDARYALAREVGERAVDAGFRILCGGLGGVMEAACRGARQAERYAPGDTIGLLPGFDPNEANAWVDIPIATGLDHLRNGLVANADAVIAIGGGAGTLSEIAFAWMYKRPIVCLATEGWSGRLGDTSLDDRGDAERGPVLISVSSAEEAVRIAAARAAGATRRHGGVRRRAG